MNGADSLLFPRLQPQNQPPSCSYNYSNITGMQQPRLLTWISDPTDRRVVAVRTLFLRALEEQSKNIINYYDFLLVAKKLNFRFEESAHLMQLRKYFFNHKNQLLNKKLAALLCLEEQSLAEVKGERLPEKIIIRFRVGEEIESIQEMTNQDQEAQEEDGEESLVPYTKTNRLKSSDKSADNDTQEYREKLTIILSIKVAEMIKKLKLLTEGLPSYQDKEETSNNIFTVFKSLSYDELPYEIFRRGVINLLKQMEAEFFREKLTMSEDDIRAVFSILDEGMGKISRERLKLLSNQPQIAKKITKFYEGRINKRMVKNTLFKLGKNSNSIQIYQVKNASVLEFRTIEDGLLEPAKTKERAKLRNPHFGPIKGSGLRQSPSRQTYSEYNQARHNNSSLSTYKREGEPNLQREREKIERIIRSSKEEKKRVGNDTIANKLRKLFIHKVILPRQKLLEEEKLKYLGSKSHSNQIIVKLA